MGEPIENQNRRLDRVDMANSITTRAVPLKSLMQSIAAAVLKAQWALDARLVQLAGAESQAISGQNSLASLPVPGTASALWRELQTKPDTLVRLHRYRISELRLEFNVRVQEEMHSHTRVVVVEPQSRNPSETSLLASIDVRATGSVCVSFAINGSLKAALRLPDS